MTNDIEPESRIHLPEAVTESNRAQARRLVAAIDEAVKALGAFPAPTLGTRFDLAVGETAADFGGEADTPLVLVCPWCRDDVRTDSLFDLEIGQRWSYAAEIEPFEGVVAINYKDGDFDSVTLMHEPCGLPVNLPEGWEQTC